MKEFITSIKESSTLPIKNPKLLLASLIVVLITGFSIDYTAFSPNLSLPIELFSGGNLLVSVITILFMTLIYFAGVVISAAAVVLVATVSRMPKVEQWDYRDILTRKRILFTVLTTFVFPVLLYLLAYVLGIVVYFLLVKLFFVLPAWLGLILSILISLVAILLAVALVAYWEVLIVRAASSKANDKISDLVVQSYKMVSLNIGGAAYITGASIAFGLLARYIGAYFGRLATTHLNTKVDSASNLVLPFLYYLLALSFAFALSSMVLFYILSIWSRWEEKVSRKLT